MTAYGLCSIRLLRAGQSSDGAQLAQPYGWWNPLNALQPNRYRGPKTGAKTSVLLRQQVEREVRGEKPTYQNNSGIRNGKPHTSRFSFEVGRKSEKCGNSEDQEKIKRLSATPRFSYGPHVDASATGRLTTSSVHTDRYSFCAQNINYTNRSRAA